MNERNVSSPETSIRFHHLSIMFDFSLFYQNQIMRKPWEIKEGDFGIFNKISKEYSKEMTNEDKGTIEYFAKLLKEQDDPQYHQIVNYYSDVVGNTPGENRDYQHRLQNFFIKILNISRDRSHKFYLTESIDGLCNSCAVGNHCYETRVFRFETDKDLIYKESVSELIKQDTERYFSRGKLGITPGGRIFLTAELLFNSKFHFLVEETAKINYPTWMRD